MFLRNCWYVAAWDHELIDGKLLRRILLEEPVLLYRGESGKLVALNDRCPHRGALLSKGGLRAMPCAACITASSIDSHREMRADPRAGDDSAEIASAQLIRLSKRGHLVWIWMGDPAKADPAQILDFPYLSDPRWKGLPGYLHYDANYLLIVDNLSDFAHLAFVHTKTLGGSEEYAYVTKPVAIERLERGFRVERWHMNSDPPPFHRKVIKNKTDKVDRRNIANMYVPGIFYMETMFAPAGSGADKGNLTGAKQYRNCQYMTPETRRTTHFFWAYLNDFEGDDTTISRSLLDSLIEGFMEDKAIIERQQKTLDDDPNFQMLAIMADAPLAHFRRVLEQADRSRTGSDSRHRDQRLRSDRGIRTRRC